MGNGCYLCDTLPWWMCCLHLVSAHVINICTHVWPLSLSRHIFHVGNIQEGIMIMTVWKGGCRTSNFFQYLEVLVQQKQVRNNMQHQPQYNLWNNKRFCHRIFIKWHKMHIASSKSPALVLTNQLSKIQTYSVKKKILLVEKLDL